MIQIQTKKPISALPLMRTTAIAVAAAAVLGACSSVEGVLGGDKVDYRSQAAKTVSLDVPPDLTQLARDSRYRPQGGPVSASGTGLTATTATTTAVAVAAVAPAAVGNVRVERQGNQRWLVTGIAPEVLWPQIKAFWIERGFAVEVDSPEAGVLETGWAENRAKLPTDFIRNTIGRLFDGLYSTGERDRFRTRVERTAAGAEIFISHRGMEEVFVAPQRDQTMWRARANDPQLEAEFLARLMVRLGTGVEAARSSVAGATEVPARARATATTGAASLEVNDGFDRAWRRVGIALDRSGFTVEDRDRAGGIYYVRYVDPGTAGKEDPGFLARLFSSGDSTSAPTRLRVAVKGEGERSLVTVQNAQGVAETGPMAQRIISLLINELR